jgi:hypothetical protein
MPTIQEQQHLQQLIGSHSIHPSDRRLNQAANSIGRQPSVLVLVAGYLLVSACPTLGTGTPVSEFLCTQVVSL